jgi:hypothetical protein
MTETTRPSLAGSFGAPAAARNEERDRAAGLTGLLPGRSSRPARTDTTSKPVSSPADPAGDQSPSTDRPAKADRPTTSPAGRMVSATADDTKLRTKPVYVPPALLEQIRADGKARELTYTDLLVESFELVEDKALRAAFVQERPETSTMPARVRAKRGTGGIQMNLRLDGAQEQWIDEKVIAVGAPSRSALVSTVFALRFEQEARGKRGSGGG